MKIALCDDNSIERFIIHQTLINLGYTEIIEFENAGELFSWLESNAPDVLLLDVEMPGITGIDAAKRIRNQYGQFAIIFLTAYENYALDAFTVYAIDYILKPVNEERLRKSLKRIKKGLPPDDRLITFSYGCKGYSIKEADIEFIEKRIYKSRIYTENEEFEAVTSLKEFEQVLNPNKFLRSHTGYIVNVTKISRIEPRGNMAYTIFFSGTDKTALLSRNKRKLLKIRVPSIQVL